MYRIDRSHIGDTFKAIHTDPTLCETVGIRVPRYRALAFVIGSFFAGISGALMAHHQGAIDPHNFEATLMVYLIIYVVVGGVETFWGPILGVIVMTIVFEVSRPLEEWRPLIAGCVLIFFLVAMPGGLELLLSRMVQGLRVVPGLGRLLNKAAS
jgi:branched-chain amino acid transport system permease protein